MIISKHLYPFVLFLIPLSNIIAQNELFISSGGLVYINNQPGTLGSYTTGVNDVSIRVNGEIVNKSGGTVTNNAGEIQITGNWTNESGAAYTSSGDEVFLGAANQRFTGEAVSATSGFAGDGSDDYFYNLLLKNKTSGQYLDLDGNLEVRGKVEFLDAFGRIRTATAANGADGNNSNFIFINNASSGSLVNFDAGSLGHAAVTDKYVEGRLRRLINSSATYSFPIGVEYNSGGTNAQKDGAETFSITSTGATNAVVEGYHAPGTTTTLGTIAYCDVGTHPGGVTGPAINCSGCTDIPDGVLDQLTFDAQQSSEWTASLVGGSIGTYSITVNPGTNLDNEVSFLNYNSGSTAMRYTSKDGLPNGQTTTNTHPVIEFPAAGYDECPNQYTISGLSSFSKFRIGGISNPSNAVLPIELLYIRATPVDNRYINVSWATASEHNVSHFELERSLNGFDFTKISSLTAAGNSNTLNTYTHDDNNAEKNTTYYYHIKAVDNDGQFEYSPIVSAKLNGDGSVITVYPNPNTVGSDMFIDYYNPKSEQDISVKVYNALGQLLAAQPFTVASGANTFSLNSQQWSWGNYFIVVSDGQNQTSFKIQIQ